ncbi:hypothetical protein KCP73_08380 [Salmonella enterica subsp. enterica]|nr:hypothetical protein KCP73_08380 [Salmonella enterica subsp. enterica]
MNQPAIAITQFVRANPTLPPARMLHHAFVNELKCRRLARLLAFVPGENPAPREAQCNY